MVIIDGMMATILVLGGIQAAFLALLLLSKRNRHLPDIILAVWLALLAAHLLIYFIYRVAGVGPVWLLNLNSSFPFLQGPFLYFYVTTLIDAQKRLRKSFLLHLVPFISFNVYVFYLANSLAPATANPIAHRHLYSVSPVFSWFLQLSVPFYVGWTLILVRRYRQRTTQVLADLEAINLAWLRTLITLLGVAWLAVLVSFFLRDPESIPARGQLIFIPVTLLVYLIGFFGFRQKVIFSDYNLDMQAGQPRNPKYSKSGLDEKAAQAMHARLVELMESEKPYLDNEITLPDLAAKLDISPNYLSQVLNGIGGESYYDFINRYRVQEFTENMRRKEFQNYTLLAVAMQSGFASKPSFNRALKKITGKTPSHFLTTVEE